MLLDDKVVIVTGVAGGLGQETARAVLDSGGRAVVAARTASRVEEVAAQVDPSGDRVHAGVVDITDQASCRSLVESALERFGRVDAVVQVAAFQDAFGGLFDADLAKWHDAFDTNVVGAVHLLRAAVPAMKAIGGGSVVLVGSQAMYKPSLPQAGYAASKAALLSASYYLADELGPDNIRVNTVVPSWMWGPNVQIYVDYRADTEGKSREEVLDEIAGGFPLRRMAEDREVADAAVFFCSDLSRAVTGQSLMVNCGEIMR